MIFTGAGLLGLVGELPSYAQHWWDVPTPAATPKAESSEAATPGIATPQATALRAEPPTPTTMAAAIPAATGTRAAAATPTSTEVPVTTPTAAPTSTPEGPRCSIAVLDQPPAEPFDLIALVEVRPQGRIDTPQASLEAAKLQGCSLGADALVILYRNEDRWSGVESPRVALGVIHNPAIRAAAIRYRQR